MTSRVNPDAHAISLAHATRACANRQLGVEGPKIAMLDAWIEGEVARIKVSAASVVSCID